MPIQDFAVCVYVVILMIAFDQPLSLYFITNCSLCSYLSFHSYSCSSLLIEIILCNRYNDSWYGNISYSSTALSSWVNNAYTKIQQTDKMADDNHYCYLFYRRIPVISISLIGGASSLHLQENITKLVSMWDVDLLVAWSRYVLTGCLSYDSMSQH